MISGSSPLSNKRKSQQPTMWINRDEGNMKLEGWLQIEINEHQTTMWMVFESLIGAGLFVKLGYTNQMVRKAQKLAQATEAAS